MAESLDPCMGRHSNRLLLCLPMHGSRDSAIRQEMQHHMSHDRNSSQRRSCIQICCPIHSKYSWPWLRKRTEGDGGLSSHNKQIQTGCFRQGATCARLRNEITQADGHDCLPAKPHGLLGALKIHPETWARKLTARLAAWCKFPLGCCQCQAAATRQLQ